MKVNKVFLAISLVLSVSGIVAQGSSTPAPTSAAVVSTPPAPVVNIVSKKGEMYLPQAGDWAIGMDATPWLNYFGNMLSSKGNTAPTATFLNSNQTILAKYFVDDHTAYRLLVRIGFNSYSQNQEIASSQTDTTFPTPQVEDQRSISSHFIGLGFGYEKRRGSTRLQGYYGAEVMFYIAGSDTSFTYGNAYDASSDATPTWYNWNSAATVSGLPRYTQNGPGSTFGISLLGFIGFEYFFLPKISIGGEFTWGLAFSSTGQGSFVKEELNPVTGADQTDTYKTGGSSNFSFDNGLNQTFGTSTGSLYITFHF